MSTMPTLKQLTEADQFLDEEKRHDCFAGFGEKLYAVFGDYPQGRERVSTQIRNLQQVAVSARRLADVEDFVKNQMGKGTRSARDWRQVGEEALAQLAELRGQADQQGQDEGQRLQLRLYLVRGWVRAVVGGYLFAKARKETEASHA